MRKLLSCAPLRAQARIARHFTVDDRDFGRYPLANAPLRAGFTCEGSIMKLTIVAFAACMIFAIASVARPAAAATAPSAVTASSNAVRLDSENDKDKDKDEVKVPEDKPKKSKKNDDKDGDEDGNAGGGNPGANH